MIHRRRSTIMASLLLTMVTAAGAWAAPGWYAGDFHNHTYLTDGSHTEQDVVSHAFGSFGLEWMANSEHGGKFNRAPNGVAWQTQYPGLALLGAPAPAPNMYRWQSLRDFSWQILFGGVNGAGETVTGLQSAYPDKVLVQAYEWNVPTHEHASVGIIEQTSGVAISDFEYLYDGGDADTSRGAVNGVTKTTTNTHAKAVAGAAYLQKNYPQASYFLLNHPSRQLKYTIADIRDFNNAAPDVAFGFEGLPGHQKETGRGGYGSANPKAQTYGGADYMVAKVGGLWDALLGEGRHFWTFVNSDFHSAAATADFYPGEYSKSYTYAVDKNARAILDGMRSGRSFAVHGDLINALDFQVSAGAARAAMGGELRAPKGSDVMVTIRFKSPSVNYNNDVPVVDHVDLIAGDVTGKIAPTDPNYTRDTNPTTHVLARFTSADWTVDAEGYNKIVYALPNLQKNQYLRLRGSNLAPDVPNQTANGEPLSDVLITNSAAEAWKDLWFYSNPIFISAGGGYVTGDFHNHTFLTDGSHTEQDVVSHAFDNFDLDWMANSEHGGKYNRAPNGVAWQTQYPGLELLGTPSPAPNMYRWQSLRDFSWQVLFGGVNGAGETVTGLQTSYPDKILIQAYEWNVPTHEHASVGVVGVTDGTPISDFEYLFDGSDADTSRGVVNGVTKTTTNTHAKAVAGAAYLEKNFPQTSYFLLNHPSRQLKYTIAQIRDFNNAAPDVAFGFEGLPGHQKETSRGGYGSSNPLAQTYGGADYMVAKVGGLWDALLGEGRHFWTFVNSDFHSAAATADFYPGEYAKSYTYVTEKSGEAVVNGLRSGNSYAVHGDLITNLEFTATAGAASAVMGNELKVTGSTTPVTLTIRFKSPERNGNGDTPVVDHIDLIAGDVNGRIAPTSPDYTRDTNPTTVVVRRFTSFDWSTDADGYNRIVYTIDNPGKMKYFRLRGSNLGTDIPDQTANGEPLSDALVPNSAAEAWKDLWFYSNPIFITAPLPVNATTTGFLYSRVTKSYNGRMTIRNTGIAPISGGITVTLDNLTAGVTLVNSTATNAGVPSLTVPLAQPLKPGQTVTVPLTFANPANALITFSPVSYQAI